LNQNISRDAFNQLKQRNISNINDARYKIGDFKDELLKVEKEFQELDAQMLQSGSSNYNKNHLNLKNTKDLNNNIGFYQNKINYNDSETKPVNNYDLFAAKEME